METVISTDGTKIAFDRFGAGPPLVMAAGAFNDRSTTEPLGRALKDRAEVFNYDRRGRGDSGDTMPYAVQREIEDLDAMIAAAGGKASVLGYSSGANLALQAAAAGSAIGRLVLYEPPFNPDERYPTLPPDLADRLADLVEAGDRGGAVELYQREAVGMPEQAVVGMRSAPFRAGMEALAHTLPYDAAVVGDRSLPRRMLAGIDIPTLVIRGEHSPPFMRAAAAAVAEALTEAELVTLPAQGHGIDPGATAAAIGSFLTDAVDRRAKRSP
jgi:pimeloyl-ACP methyl ester carboxylesterase